MLEKNWYYFWNRKDSSVEETSVGFNSANIMQSDSVILDLKKKVILVLSIILNSEAQNLLKNVILCKPV